jgi:hypothetical protein
VAGAALRGLRGTPLGKRRFLAVSVLAFAELGQQTSDLGINHLERFAVRIQIAEQAIEIFAFQPRDLRIFQEILRNRFARHGWF